MKSTYLTSICSSVLSAALLCFAAPGCDVDKTQEGELPSVDVDVEGEEGKLPEYDVETADVDVGTEKETIEVPDVDVETEEQTLEVPDIDVDMPDDE